MFEVVLIVEEAQRKESSCGLRKSREDKLCVERVGECWSYVV